MRDVISGRVFDHTKRMTGDLIKSRIVRGGSGKVEQVMRAAGCDPLTPSAAVSVYVLDTGKVNAAKLVLAGTMPNFEIKDVSSIFPNAPKSASMKFDNLNLNSLRFMTSQMSTRWIPDSEFSWNLMVDGLNDEGASERITISPKNFTKYDVANISMRVMAQPISADKIKVTVGIAPVAYDALKKTDNFDAIGFPLVEVNTFTVDFFPLEDANTNHGIGVQPYILMTKGDIETNTMPESADIKTAVCDLLASSTMPSAKKSTKRWKEAIEKNDWKARESSKEWPTPIDSGDELEPNSEDVSGRKTKYNF